MLTKSDRETMTGLGEGVGYAWIWHARSFIPAALADLDEKDALLARVMEDAGWAAATVHERETYSACPACMLPVHIGHAPACIFAEIARHLAGVRGGTEDGRNDL